jgi:hypothetical protein
MEGTACINNFLESMKSYEIRFEKIRGYWELQGKLNSQKENLLRRVLNNTLLEPDLMATDLAIVFKQFNMTGYQEKDVVALVKYYTGEWGTVAFRNMFKHHSSKFILQKIIYGCLSDANLFTESDRFKLGIGRKGISCALEIAKVSENHQLIEYQHKGYTIRIGKEVGVKDVNYERLISAIRSEVSNVEFYYPDKNVLVISD